MTAGEQLAGPPATMARSRADPGFFGRAGSLRARHLMLVGVVLVATGVPVALALVTGSLSIPHNDAWSHARIAETFARTGQFQLIGWNRTALVGQVVVLGPLGSSVAAQQLAVAVLSVVALVATYGYLKSRVGTAGALLGTAIVGFTPEFGLLATSYMSDMPAFAAVIVCLVLTDVALRTGRPGYLAGALAVGVWGVTIREQSLVAPVAAVIVVSLAWRGRRRMVALLLGAIAGGTVVGFELWRRSLALSDSPGFELNLHNATYNGMRAVFTVALYLSPAVLWVARPRRWSARTRGVCVGVLGIALAAAAGILGGRALLGNYLAQGGAYARVAIGTRTVIPGWAWLALVLVACVSLALLAGILIETRFQLDRMSLLVGIFLIVGTLGQAAAGQSVFARYLLPLIPIACVPVLKSLEPSRWRRALPALAVLLVASVAITANALSFDAARWRAATQVEAQGIPATDIDAGLEWVGYHAAGDVTQGVTRPGAASWYTGLFPGSRECYIVSASPLAGRHVMSTYPYATYALVGASTLWVYEQSPCR